MEFQEEMESRMYGAEELWKMFNKINGGLISNEKSKEVQKNYEDLIAKLIREKERFVHILRTEPGSVYFRAEDGLVRLSREEEGYHLVPAFHHVFYISETELGRLLKLRNEGDHYSEEDPICHTPFEIGEPKEGTIPIDFGIWRFGPLALNVENNILTIHGDPKDPKGGLSGFGFHYGDKIVEIIK